MKLNNFFNNIYNNFENKKGKLAEIIAFVLYFAGIVCLAYFHEPWFDEFQALQISKSSIHDILFVIPHMEGHPPLWHLILKFVSAFTTQPDLCIKIPNVIFSSLAAWLIIFKSPFNRIVRVSLPFTYFIFYQYGVISRPYSILMFALFLTACLYQKKNEKPFLFVASLGLLCLSSCYGVLIAFAITIAWLIEIWNKQQIISFIKSFLKDKRFYAMLSLFFLCLFIFFEIYPTSNALAHSQIAHLPIYERILYSLFGFLADATFSNVANLSNLDTTNIIDFYSIIATFGGAYLTYLLFRYFVRNSFILFALTYSLFILFIYIVYFWPHHIGLLTLILIFNFWCSYFKNNVFQKPKFDKYLKIMICLVLIIQIYWSVSSAFFEIKNDYSYGTSVATYIKNNNIAYNYKILCPWWNYEEYFDENGKKIEYLNDVLSQHKKIKYVQHTDIFSYQPFAIEINTYFPKNIFYNFNAFYPKYNYVLHSDPKDMSEEKVFSKWRSFGEPDIVFASASSIIFDNLRIDEPELKKIEFLWERVYGDKVNLSKDYFPVRSFPHGHAWKSEYYDGELNMYVKKSLYNIAKNWK